MPVICKHNVPAVGAGLLHIEDMCTTEVPGYACYSALPTAVTW